MGTGSEFIEKTKYRYAEPPDQSRGFAQPPLSRRFVTGDTVALPAPGDTGKSPITVMDAIANRSSTRSYSPEPASREEISSLLWLTQGVRRLVPGHATFRTVPSAGARHALETLLLVNRCHGLDPGLYQYLPLEHSLGVHDRTGGLDRALAAACLGQRMIVDSPLVFIWCADRYRMTWRYGERGYRYLFLDAGHACQNLYLAAESMGWGVCAIAAFDDDVMNEILGLDGNDCFAIYLATAGRRVPGNQPG